MVARRLTRASLTLRHIFQRNFRRAPTQLMESLFCLLGGLATLALFLWHGLANGAIFVAAMSAYTLFREWLLRIRVEKYETPLPQLAIPVASALVFIGSVICIVAARTG